MSPLDPQGQYEISIYGRDIGYIYLLFSIKNHLVCIDLRESEKGVDNHSHSHLNYTHHNLGEPINVYLHLQRSDRATDS